MVLLPRLSFSSTGLPVTAVAVAYAACCVATDGGVAVALGLDEAVGVSEAPAVPAAPVAPAVAWLWPLEPPGAWVLGNCVKR